MSSTLISQRFRGFLPVVVDVETGGFDKDKDALLEVAAVLLNFDEVGKLIPVETLHYHVKPFAGSNIEPASLKLTGIDPFHPLRPALEEAEVAKRLFGRIREYQKMQGCSRTILVGHNAPFDLGFIKALSSRTQYDRDPFHPFSCLDTVSLGALAYGQTVLARIASAAEIEYDTKQAHGARYDTELTAKIFCKIVNLWSEKIGVPVGL